MSPITDLIRSDRFRQRLEGGRGNAPVLMVYRGERPGVVGDDGEQGRAVAGLQSCLDDLIETVGMPIAKADVFCSTARVTLTCFFEIDGADADLVVGYDSVTGRIDLEILHRDVVSIDHGSLVELAHAIAEPTVLLGVHFTDERIVRDVAALMDCLGLEPKPIAEAKVAYETHTLSLRDR